MIEQLKSSAIDLTKQKMYVENSKKELKELELETGTVKPDLKQLYADVRENIPQEVLLENVGNILLSAVKIEGQLVGKIIGENGIYKMYDKNNKEIATISSQSDLENLHILGTDGIKSYKIKFSDEGFLIVDKNATTITRKKDIESMKEGDLSSKVVLATIDGHDTSKTYNINALKIKDVSGTEITNGGGVDIDTITGAIYYIPSGKEVDGEYTLKFNVIPVGMGKPLYDQEFTLKYIK